MIARKNLSCASKFGCALAKFGCALAGVASKATVGEVKPLDLATRANDGTRRSSRQLAYARSHDFVLNGILDPSRSPINAVMIMGQSRRSRRTPSMRHSLNGKTASEFTFSSKGDFYEQIHSDNSIREIKQPKPLPSPNSDFYEFAETLPAEELAVLKQVRAFMEKNVAPIITKYWVEDAFPFQLIPALKELNIGGVGIEGYGCRGGSQLLVGLLAMELARFDASIATFVGVHTGLAMGSIYLGGSEEQKQKWLPPMARWEKIGCFGFRQSGEGRPGRRGRRWKEDSQRDGALDRGRRAIAACEAARCRYRPGRPSIGRSTHECVGCPRRVRRRRRIVGRARWTAGAGGGAGRDPAGTLRRTPDCARAEGTPAGAPLPLFRQGQHGGRRQEFRHTGKWAPAHEWVCHLARLGGPTYHVASPATEQVAGASPVVLVLFHRAAQLAINSRAESMSLERTQSRVSACIQRHILR